MAEIKSYVKGSTRYWDNDKRTNASPAGRVWLVVAPGWLTPQPRPEVQAEVVQVNLYIAKAGSQNMCQAADGRCWRYDSESLAGDYETREEAEARASELRAQDRELRA